MAAATTTETDRSPSPPLPAVSVRPPWTLAAVIGGLFGLWALSFGLAPLGDNTFFTHLATGRLILVDGIPRTDPYSFTAGGEPWVVQSWLASLVYALVERAGGLTSVRLLIGLSTALIALLAWRLTARAGSLLARVGAVALVVGIGASTWTARPLLFGLLGLALTLLVVERGGPAWVLLPVYWVWANTHGSFPLGLVAIAAIAVGSRLDGDRPRAELRALAWAAGGTLLAVVNPLGARLLWFPVQMLGRQAQLREIIEWQSPQFHLTWTRLFLVLVAVAVAALVRRPSWRAAVPFVVFTVAALLAVRNVAPASLVLLPGIAYGLAGLGSLDGLKRSRAASIGLVAVVLLAVVMTLGELRRADLDLRDFPADAVAWMDDAGMVGNGSPGVASTEIAGNYLELVYGPDAAVFIDDRFDMFPSATIDDYLVLRRGQLGWSTVLDRHRIDAVLWPRESPLTSIMLEDQRWRLVYEDEGWVVFEPR